MGDWGFMVLSPEDSAVTGSHRQSPEALADVLDERVESKLSANEKARSLASSDVVSNTRQFLPSCSIIFYSSSQWWHFLQVDWYTVYGMPKTFISGRFGISAWTTVFLVAGMAKAFFVAYKSFMLRPQHTSSDASSVLVMGSETELGCIKSMYIWLYKGRVTRVKITIDACSIIPAVLFAFCPFLMVRSLRWSLFVSIFAGSRCKRNLKSWSRRCFHEPNVSEFAYPINHGWWLEGVLSQQ